MGLGAIGSVYAVAFAKAGVSLRVALDAGRLTRYREMGVIFNGARYDFDFYTPSSEDESADLVIIAVKSAGLERALELIRPIVGERTQILPLLNGITSEEICAAKYGWSRVVYGYFIGHTATRYGNEIHQDGHYRTYFGEFSTNLTPRIKAIKLLFDKADIPYKIPEDMIASLWQKFIINIGMNQATAILRCTYGHLQSSQAAHDYMVALMDEAAQVAGAEGIADSAAMVEKAVSLLATLSPEDGSSMYQDVMSGRPTEVDIFADTVCALGAKHGISTPYNFYAATVLKAL